MKYDFTGHRFLLFPLFFLAILCGCSGNGDSDERQLMDCVDSFSNYYYNWEFYKLTPFVTQESLPWLRFASSQVSQVTLDMLMAHPVAVSWEQEAVEYTSDSTAVVALIVHDYLRPDTIGKAGHFQSADRYQLRLRYVDNCWRVDLQELPRPLKGRS